MVHIVLLEPQLQKLAHKVNIVLQNQVDKHLALQVSTVQGLAPTSMINVRTVLIVQVVPWLKLNVQVERLVPAIQ